MGSHRRPYSRSAATVSVRFVVVIVKHDIQSCASRVEQLWNVSNGAVLLAWQAADAAVIAAGFLSPNRIVVVGADAVVRSELVWVLLFKHEI